MTFSYFETEEISFRKYWYLNPRVWDCQSIILKISKIMTGFFSKFHRSCLHPSSLDPFAIITGIGRRKTGLNIYFALGRDVNHRPLKSIHKPRGQLRGREGQPYDNFTTISISKGLSPMCLAAWALYGEISPYQHLLCIFLNQREGFIPLTYYYPWAMYGDMSPAQAPAIQTTCPYQHLLCIFLNRLQIGGTISL